MKDKQTQLSASYVRESSGDPLGEDKKSEAVSGEIIDWDIKPYQLKMISYGRLGGKVKFIMDELSRINAKNVTPDDPPTLLLPPTTER